MKTDFAPLEEFLRSLVSDAVSTALEQHQKLLPPASPKEKELEQIMNLQQACEFLHLAKPTLYTLTSRQKIPHFKKGKKVLFRKSELITWLEEGRQVQAPVSSAPKRGRYGK